MPEWTAQAGITPQAGKTRVVNLEDGGYGLAGSIRAPLWELPWTRARSGGFAGRHGNTRWPTSIVQAVAVA